MEWDFIVIGSGFGGSVSALRLVEKGYRVLVLEKGRRMGPEDFPKSNWNLRRWLWAPRLGFRGLFKMTFFRRLTALTGVGVGGGSLMYANTLPIPRDDFFSASSWAHLAPWKAELEQHYATARKMLGVTRNPMLRDPELTLRAVAEQRGQLGHYEPTEVAVYFGTEGETAPDPFFDGQGPARTGCIGCGGCMIGCRHGAKNTLVQNYLYLAEQKGLTVQPDTEVTWVRPLETGEGYRVTARRGRSLLPGLCEKQEHIARNVIFAGGVVGTVPLLLKLRQSPRGLPQLSHRLGHAVRTNSEALIGVTSQRRDIDLSAGIAIGAILQTDPHSHLELVRYPAGSGAFRLLMLPHVAARGPLRRLGRALWTVLRHPIKALRAYLVPDWAKYTTILLYMRTIEGTLRLKLRRGWTRAFRRSILTCCLEEGTPPQASIPEASQLAEQIAQRLEGLPVSLINETLLDVPTTAHVLGGCGMGRDAEEGVIDPRHRVFGYDGLYVVDGSAVSANPGVNPSLTITALAERAMSLIPPRDAGEV